MGSSMHLKIVLPDILLAFIERCGCLISTDAKSVIFSVELSDCRYQLCLPLFTLIMTQTEFHIAIEIIL